MLGFTDSADIDCMTMKEMKNKKIDWNTERERQREREKEHMLV